MGNTLKLQVFISNARLHYVKEENASLGRLGTITPQVSPRAWVVQCYVSTSHLLVLVSHMSLREHKPNPREQSNLQNIEEKTTQARDVCTCSIHKAHINIDVHACSWQT